MPRAPQMVRRFVLVGLFVIVEPGTVTQVVGGTLFCAVYLTVQLQLAPYRKISDGFVAAASSFGLLGLFTACLIFK